MAAKHMAEMDTESEKAKSILPLDYDEEDSEEEEEDDELFDNSKVDWRVKGNLLRGKDFSVSDNGNCPRCQSNIFVFVILDELFPMGDMPEILYNLLAKGKAVLWSSQDKQLCKKPPTFMCKGFCPSDPLGAGFNINWDTVNLTKLLKDLLKLNMSKAQKKLRLMEKGEAKDEDSEDVNEKDIIRAMLAKEKEKEVEASANEQATENLKTETSTSTMAPTLSSATVMSSAPVASTPTTAVVSTTTTSTTSGTSKVEYPVSKDGSCPYCSSTNVRYIILVKDTSKDASLPPTLDLLLKQGKAFKMAKGANNPPSFQCCSCTYGFNLDWSSTNLKKIFKLDDPAPAVTTPPTSSTSYSYQFPSHPPTAQPASYQNAHYAPYGYPFMYYPATTAAYSYPTPGYGVPTPGVPPIHGLPPPYAGNPPPPPFSGHAPPAPFGGNPQPPAPYTGNPPPFTGGQPVRGPIRFPLQPGDPQIPPRYPNMPPNSVYGSYGQSYHGDFNQPPSRPLLRPQPHRLRIPRGPLRGRFNNRNPRWPGPEPQQTYHVPHDQWSTYTQEALENQGMGQTDGATGEVSEHPVLDQQAADRFEKLLNKIDGKSEDAEDTGEDEKPPGEDSQAEFEVTPFSNTAEETRKQPENSEKIGSEKERPDNKINGKPNDEPNATSNNVNSVPDQPNNEITTVANNQSNSKSGQHEEISSGAKTLEEISSDTMNSVSSSNSATPEKVPTAFKNSEPSLKSERSEEIALEVESSRERARQDKSKLEMDAEPNNVPGKVETQNKVTSEVESQESEEVEMSPATGSRKSTRSRKRQSAGKKKATNTRGGKKKKIEQETNEETSTECVEQETKEETSPKPQNGEEKIKEELKEKEQMPTRRMTRARAQKLKS